MKPYAIILLTYVVLLVLKWATDKKEFKRCPEKGERYSILPLRFKFACSFVVIPIFVLGTVGPFVFDDELYAIGFFLSLICFAVLETRVVKWYSKNGHY